MGFRIPWAALRILKPKTPEYGFPYVRRNTWANPVFHAPLSEAISGNIKPQVSRWLPHFCRAWWPRQGHASQSVIDSCHWIGQCCVWPDLPPRHVFDPVGPLKKLLCTKLFPWNTVNVTALVFYIPDLANGAFLSVDRDNDVCKCDQGTCDCNKDTQRSFCSCFKGFEGITSKLRRSNQMVTSQIRE